MTSGETPIQCDVAIVGAGPVGLVLANLLGQSNVRVLVLEQREQLIDYPRAIGIDDESLRTIQSIGLIEQVLPHITPYHRMRFLSSSGRCIASLEPRSMQFGWSRRNAFIQPLIDRVFFEALSRFPDVNCQFQRQLTDLSQDDTGVSLSISGPDGKVEKVRAAYLIAADGGNSFVRGSLGIPFEGRTAPNKWIVIDVANDPIGTPNVYLCADPERPYVSGSLPHGIRRFEFMVMADETEEEMSQPEKVRKLLARVVPDPASVDVIRQRVYTHNARLAARFRQGRVILAGDAAHIMPVWQGQGYNSGIRDAANLAWKLSLVVKGVVDSSVLDSYEVERRPHAKAMIDLSVLVGQVLVPPWRWMGTARDILFTLINYLPRAKSYFLEMRFKPMPKLEEGVIVNYADHRFSAAVGQLMIQPRVDSSDNSDMLFDDLIGPRFAIIAWGTNPLHGLSTEVKDFWRELGAGFFRVLPRNQLSAVSVREGVTDVGDAQGSFKQWFDAQPASIIVLRPDRVIAAMSSPQELDADCRLLAATMGVPMTAKQGSPKHCQSRAETWPH